MPARQPARAEVPVHITAADATLEGSLGGLEGGRGVVLFAHGSGSSRHSPRNRAVAAVIRQRGLETLLFDLLTPEEQAVDIRTRELRFDIPFLANRLRAAALWLRERPGAAGRGVGFFGSNTGAAAALAAAAAEPELVRAVVSRGGRPDLAGDALERVAEPARDWFSRHL